MNIGLALLFLLLPCHGFCSGLYDYLKKPINKSGHHKIKNIDFIYMINLDQRPEKFARSVQQLAPYKIEPYRFSAVNGWELSLETINNLGVKYQAGMINDLWGTCYLDGENWAPLHEVMHCVGRNYFCHCMTRGAIGIVLSHLSILKNAYDSGYKTIWVMEDDIEVVQNPHMISLLISKLDAAVGKKGWDILFTDRDTKNQQGEYVSCLSYARRPNFSPLDPSRFANRKLVGTDFINIGARYGAYSMIVRRSGMKKILDFFNRYNVFLPFDMDFCMPNDIHLYSVVNDVVSTQPRALSDNGSPGYQNKK